MQRGSRLPHLPDGDCAAILLLSSSPSPLFRSPPSPTPTSRDKFRGRHKRRERTTGNCLPVPSTPSLALPSSSPLGGGRGVKIRPAWDCLLLLLSGKDAPLESIVHFPLHNSKFSFSDGYQSVHFCSGLVCCVAEC
jgi:hypothetical protein